MVRGSLIGFRVRPFCHRCTFAVGVEIAGTPQIALEVMDVVSEDEVRSIGALERPQKQTTRQTATGNYYWLNAKS